VARAQRPAPLHAAPAPGRRLGKRAGQRLVIVPDPQRRLGAGRAGRAPPAGPAWARRWLASPEAETLQRAARTPASEVASAVLRAGAAARPRWPRPRGGGRRAAACAPVTARSASARRARAASTSPAGSGAGSAATVCSHTGHGSPATRCGRRPRRHWRRRAPPVRPGAGGAPLRRRTGRASAASRAAAACRVARSRRRVGPQSPQVTEVGVRLGQRASGAAAARASRAAASARSFPPGRPPHRMTALAASVRRSSSSAIPAGRTPRACVLGRQRGDPLAAVWAAREASSRSTRASVECAGGGVHGATPRWRAPASRKSAPGPGSRLVRRARAVRAGSSRGARCGPAAELRRVLRCRRLATRSAAFVSPGLTCSQQVRVQFADCRRGPAGGQGGNLRAQLP